jgi:eukaryotic-like serine/threonine-protein kinase
VQTASADLLVGRLLEGRYRILDRIAQGGMSTVYAAVDERLDRLVAVKVMSSTLSSDPKFGDRFAREARSAAKLTHVNAVAVYDQGHDVSDGGHHVFLVMELVEGRTLRDLIRERNGRFTPAEAISIMEPVLAALAAAHRAGLVHRDVKPENILLSDAGIVKVADFGLARAIDADASSTRTGLMMGTVAYCSPEQISRGHADARSDVYAAGVVLFELLTGHPPYQGETAMNVAWQHVHNRVPAPSSQVKGIPNEIDELVVATTDSDPAGRPADGAAFLAEVADVRATLGLPVAPIPARPRTSAAVDPRDGRARASTEVLDGTARRGHDTEVVGRAPMPPVHRDDAPPPPIVIPPPKQRKQRTAKSRRRRRAWIAFAIVVIVGALSVFGGIAATRWYQRWNSHVPRLVGQSLTQATATIEREHYEVGRISREFSESVPKNEVMSTDPGKGARLEEGKAINLTVSLGQETVQVPYVKNQTLPAAEQILQVHGVRYVPSPKYASSTTVPEGKVISVEPGPGTTIKKTDTVQLTVSTGPPIVDIPTIGQGTPYDEAEQALKDKKFDVKRVDEYSDQVSAGQVITTSPVGRARLGSTITVTVSKGPEFVTMPAIPLLTPFGQAKTQLEQLGLIVHRDKVGKKDRNLVIDQNPHAGESVHVGTIVTLTVF